MGPVLVKNMQTPHLKKSRFDFLVRIIKERSETEKKSDFVPSYDQFCSQFSRVFNRFFFSSKMRNVLIGVFVSRSFFVWFLVFEL